MSVYTPTQKELQLMVAVLSSGQIIVSDWQAIANAADMKTGKYARDTWTGLKKKIIKAAEGGGGGGGGGAVNNPSPATNKGTPAKGGAGTGGGGGKASKANTFRDNDDEEIDDECGYTASPSPSETTKGKGKKRKGGTPAPSSSPRKRKTAAAATPSPLKDEFSDLIDFSGGGDGGEGDDDGLSSALKYEGADEETLFNP